jgi:hypothetical protein
MVVCQEKEEIEGKEIKIILDYLKSFYQEIQTYECVAANQEESFKYVLKQLLSNKYPTSLSEKGMSQPKRLIPMAWNIFTLLMKERGSKLITNLTDFKDHHQQLQKGIKKIVYFSKNENKI